MADQTLEIQIKTLAELGGIKSAVKELNNLKISSNQTQAEMKGLFSGLSSSLAGIPAQLAGIGAGFLTFRAAAGLISGAVTEALEAEKALNRLTVSLEGTNEATQENIKSFQQFAAQIQATTRFGDDLVIEQLAIAKSFGLTNAEAKKLVETATDLSAVTGKDLNSSTEDLLKTLSGQLPRELKLLGREFSNLTAEQLKAGVAIDLLIGKFGSRAEKDVKTLSGAFAQFKNVLSDASEEVGKSIVSTGLLQNVLNKVSGTVKRVFGLESETEQLARLRAQLEKTTLAVDRFVLNKKILEIELKIKDNSFKQVNDDIDEQIKNAKTRNASVIEVQFQVDQGAKQKFLEDIKRVGLSTTEIAKQERDARLAELKKIFGDEAGYSKLSVDDRKAAVNAKIKIEKEFTTAVLKNQKEQSAKEAAELRNRQEIYKNAASNMAASFANIISGKATKEEFAGAAFGVGQAVTQGRSGAKGLLQVGTQLGGDAIAPGLGSVAAPIVGALSEGKEAAKQFVTEFLNAIPDLIMGLTEGIIAAWETLIIKIPEIVDRIIDNIPRMITAIIEALPEITAGFAEMATVGAVRFADSLIENTPRIVEAIVKGLANTPGNAAKSVGRIFKFAEGGQFVKSVPPGFGNGSTERFPAVLGSGELVVDRSTAFKLKEFLDNRDSSSSSNGEGSASIMDAVMALVNRPVIVQIDGREVARATRNQLKSGFVL